MHSSRSLVIGSPIANRPRPELDGLIGLFANLIVLRTKVSPGTTFRKLLAGLLAIEVGGHTQVEDDRLGIGDLEESVFGLHRGAGRRPG